MSQVKLSLTWLMFFVTYLRGSFVSLRGFYCGFLVFFCLVASGDDDACF